MFKYLYLFILTIPLLANAIEDSSEDIPVKLICNGELKISYPYASRPEKVLSRAPLSLNIYPSTGVAFINILPFGAYDFSHPFLFEIIGSSYQFKSEKHKDEFSQFAKVLIDRDTGILNVIEEYEYKRNASKNAITSGVYHCKKIVDQAF